jgi:hypothetical protein
MATLNEIKEVAPDISDVNSEYWEVVASGKGMSDETLLNFNSGLPMTEDQIRAVQGQILRPDQDVDSELAAEQVEAVIRGVADWIHYVVALEGDLPDACLAHMVVERSLRDQFSNVVELGEERLAAVG